MSSQPAHGRVIKGVWRKAVRKSAHMLRYPHAWAVDLSDLEAAERLDVKTLELREQEEGLTYRVALGMFRCSGFEFDRGFGSQVALALGHFEVARPGEERVQQLAFDWGGQ